MLQLNLSKSKTQVKAILEKLYKEAQSPGFLENDPLQFPRRYADRMDVEIVAFFSALMAWGKRSIILSKLEDLFRRMTPSPGEFVRNYKAKRGSVGSLKGFKHRTFNDHDVAGLTLALQKIYKKYGSLEKLFEEGLTKTKKSSGDEGKNDALKNAISHFVTVIRKASAEAGFPLEARHLPHPLEGGSACKRMNLFLRWMVRKGEFDLGLWNCIGPESLIIPLDLVVGRAARCIGLTVRKDSNKWETAEYITDSLKIFDPNDPIRFDFAMSQIGCPPEGDYEPCKKCEFERKDK